MLDRPKYVEKAQTLVDTIGFNTLLNYFSNRLSDTENDFSTRPNIISAYGKLAQTNAIPILEEIASDLSETIPSRVAAVKTLAFIFVNKAEIETRQSYEEFLLNLSYDKNDEFLNEVAIALANIQSKSSIYLDRINELYLSRNLSPQAKGLFRDLLNSQNLLSSFPSESNFVGRQQELLSLKDALDQDLIVGILGLGGIGKTSLAKEFTRRYREYYDAIIYLHLHNVNYQDTPSLETVIIESINSQLLIPENRKYEGIVVLEKVATENSLLIIFDDFEAAPDSIGILLKKLKRLKIKILLVGRSIKQQDFVMTYINLAPLSVSQMSLYFNRAGIEISDKEKNKILNLSKGHPLIIDLLLQQIERDEIIDLDEFEEDYSKNFSFIFERTFNNLDVTTYQTLRIMAQFDDGVNINDPGIRKVFELEQVKSLEKVFEELKRFSFVRIGPRSNDFQLHDIIRSFLVDSEDKRTTIRINLSIAEYYDNKKDYFRSAKHYIRANKPDKAFERILKLVDSQEVSLTDKSIVFDHLVKEEESYRAINNNLAYSDLVKLLAEELGLQDKVIKYGR